MNKITKIISKIALILIVLSVSCKKDSDPADSTKRSNPQVSFTINGKSWVSNPANQSVNWIQKVKLFSSYKGINAFIRNDTLVLIAFQLKQNDSTLIFMRVPLTSQKIGKYTLTDPNNNIYYSDLSLVGTLTLDPLSRFTFEVTKFDAVSKTFSATFSGTTQYYPYGSDDYRVTNGLIEDVSFQ